VSTTRTTCPIAWPAGGAAQTTPHGAVLAWLQGVEDAHLHLAAVTLGEIQAGIELSREQDPGKARDLET